MHMTKSTGNERSLESFFMAGDGSCVWSKLSWNLAAEKRGDASSVKREGRYRVPTVWEGDELYAASEVYGPLLVDFAERALAGGVPIGSGECWDLASLALKEIKETRSDLPEPFPSISFCHGHLIYYAKVGGMKVWKGGDSYVRPGDIVQWKEAQVGDLNVTGKSYSLGAPDVRHLFLAFCGRSYLCFILSTPPSSSQLLHQLQSHQMALLSLQNIWFLLL
jgi:hypothetical protein